MLNAGNRKDVRQAEKLAAQAESIRGEFTRTVMSTTQGRQWINDILVRCHIFHNPMTDSERWTTFALGEMNIGQQILADIMTYCPDQYVQMQREANDRRILNNVRDANVNPDRDPGTEHYGSPDPDWGIEGRADTDYALDGTDAD